MSQTPVLPHRPRYQGRHRRTFCLPPWEDQPFSHLRLSKTVPILQHVSHNYTGRTAVLSRVFCLLLWAVHILWTDRYDRWNHCKKDGCCQFIWRKAGYRCRLSSCDRFFCEDIACNPDSSVDLGLGCCHCGGETGQSGLGIHANEADAFSAHHSK